MIVMYHGIYRNLPDVCPQSGAVARSCQSGGAEDDSTSPWVLVGIIGGILTLIIIVFVLALSLTPK